MIIASNSPRSSFGKRSADVDRKRAHLQLGESGS